VVLPAPFWPSRPKMAPRSTSRLTPRSASTRPYRLARSPVWITDTAAPSPGGGMSTRYSNDDTVEKIGGAPSGARGGALGELERGLGLHVGHAEQPAAVEEGQQLWQDVFGAPAARQRRLGRGRLAGEPRSHQQPHVVAAGDEVGRHPPADG